MLKNHDFASISPLFSLSFIVGLGSEIYGYFYEDSFIQYLGKLNKGDKIRLLRAESFSSPRDKFITRHTHDVLFIVQSIQKLFYPNSNSILTENQSYIFSSVDEDDLIIKKFKAKLRFLRITSLSFVIALAYFIYLLMHFFRIV